jgi:hypothetical protein
MFIDFCRTPPLPPPFQISRKSFHHISSAYALTDPQTDVCQNWLQGAVFVAVIC